MGTAAAVLDLPYLDTMGLSRSDAVAAYRKAASQNWLARMPLGYVATRYEDVVAILRDKRWHSAVSMMTQVAGLDDDSYMGRRRESILAMEGDGHTRLRRIVAPAFTPASADRLRPFMRSVVTSLIDGVIERGSCELVADICDPYPIPIICELLGAPKEDWKQFSLWATDIFRVFNQNLIEDLPIIERASNELEEYVRAMISRRRSSPSLPTDDLLSALIAAEEQGDRLSTDEVVMMAEAVLMAGTDTTRNQLACSVALFTEHPDQWAMLGSSPDPSLAARAVEESMRFLGAVRGTARVASAEISYRDVVFPAGTLIETSLAAANLDGSAFERPDTFDITAERHVAQMTFGSGIHFCMGAALARAELQEALPLLAARLPGLRLREPIEWKPATFGIWGPARLAISWDRSGSSSGPRPGPRSG